MINASIRRCLGGSDDVADRIRKVALGLCPVTELLRLLPNGY